MCPSEPDNELVEVGLAIATSISIARCVTVEQAEAYALAARNSQEREHTIGPLLDPTAYRRKGPEADKVARVARAFADLRAAIEEARSA